MCLRSQFCLLASLKRDSFLSDLPKLANTDCIRTETSGWRGELQMVLRVQALLLVVSDLKALLLVVSDLKDKG